jgi:hypothetical protein
VSRPPALWIVVGLEAAPRVWLVARSLEDERRLALDLERRQLIAEVSAALEALLAGLEERAA